MPPVVAWPLAFITSIALLLAAALLFGGSGAQHEIPVEGPDENPEVTREVGTVEQAVYLGLLVVPVGLIPMVARRKRKNAMRWSIAGVGVGFLQLVLQLICIHPLMVLLALVYLPSSPPTAPAAATDVLSARASKPEDEAAARTDGPPRKAPALPARRRPLRQRRRPRH